MKLSVANIPLTFFAGFTTGLVGVIFCVAPLSVLPSMIRAHGLVSFVPMMDIFVACVGFFVVARSIGVGFRRRWAHVGLVRSMLGLMIVCVLAIGRKALQDNRAASERLMDVAIGPGLVILMGVVLLFLVNRRVQDELAPRPNEAPEATPGDRPPLLPGPSFGPPQL